MPKTITASVIFLSFFIIVIIALINFNSLAHWYEKGTILERHDVFLANENAFKYERHPMSSKEFMGEITYIRAPRLPNKTHGSLHLTPVDDEIYYVGANIHVADEIIIVWKRQVFRMYRLDEQTFIDNKRVARAHYNQWHH